MSCGIGDAPLTVMKKKVLSISFVFALLANGLGSVLAANWCLYQRCMPAVAENEHSIAHETEASKASMASEDSHCSGASKPADHGHHQAASVKQPQPSIEQESVSQRNLRSHCGHCVSAPQAPAKFSFKSSTSETRRDAGSDKQQVMSRFVLPGVASFPALTPSQGAPPVPSPRRHLLINVFLI